MVKSFTQHLHLYDAIQLAASKSGNNVILLLFVHFAVNLMRLTRLYPLRYAIAPFVLQPAQHEND